MSKNFCIICATLLILPVSDAIATTIAFLPGHWEGIAPQSIEGTGEKPFELSRLGQFYASKAYLVKIRDTFRDQKDPDAVEYLRAQLSKDQFREACLRFKTDYVVRDNVEIQTKIRIDRFVFDCNLSRWEEFSSVGKRDLFEIYEKLTQESFPFVPKKRIKELINKKINTPKIQIFLVDGSFSFAPERKEFMSQIDAFSWRPETRFRLAVFGEGGFSKVFPESSRTELRNQWKDWKPTGKSMTTDLGNSLVRLRRILVSEDKMGTKPDLSVIILTNAKEGKNDSSYPAAIEALKQIGSKVTILYSAYSGPESRRVHKDATSRGAEFREVTYFQRIVTPRDSKTLVFQGGRLFTTQQVLDPSAEIDESVLEKVEMSGSYLAGEFLNPWALSEIYEKIRNEKVISSEPVRSNFSLLFAKSVSNSAKDQVANSGKKALIKTKGKAFWMQFPTFFELSEGKKGVWKVTFLSSAFSSEGVEVLPESVEAYPYSPPKTLDCDPSTVRNYFQNTEKSKFDCLVRGEILELSRP
ncbi:LIC10012 family protein [Leptospira fainei]|uniref:LIC10012 family protein n=1 Tax=Leptospira fainei TaxID=48782 RepID=UPI000587C0B1|nr:vWA domain-containing protein [Leptospira fainei]